MPHRNELRTVQSLRAAACLLVVIYHGLLQGWPAAARAWPNGSAGVDLFFVISGFVMIVSSRGLEGPGGARTFLARRLRRIVPLYWFMTAAKLAAVLLAPGLAAHTRPSPWNVVASFLFIPAADASGQIRPLLPVGWTLEFEMLFYALFAVALAWRARPLLALAPVLAALALAGFWRQPGPAMFLANGMVLEFAFGMAIGQAWQRGRFRQARAGWPWLAAGTIALLLLPLAGPWRFLSWGCPAAAILVGALSLERTYGHRMPRLAVASGDASYATYLSHPFVMPALGWLGPLAPVAAVPASLLAGWAVHRGIDRRLHQLLAGRARPSFSQAAS